MLTLLFLLGLLIMNSAEHIQRLLAERQAAEKQASQKATLTRSSSADIGEMLANGSAVKDYSNKTLIGEGAQAKVHLVKVDFKENGKPTTRLVVEKTLSQRFPNNFIQKGLTEKFNTSSESNIIKVMQTTKNAYDQDVITMAYCKTSLDSEIKDIQSLKVSDLKQHHAMVITSMIGIISGVMLTHKENIVHRDLNPNNIMRHDSGECCLMDYGIAKPLASELEKDPIGTTYFIHPACGDLEGLSTHVFNDIYAIGKILELLINPKLNWREDSLVDYVNRGDEYSSLSSSFSKVPKDKIILIDKIEAMSIDESLNEIIRQMTILDQTRQPDLDVVRASLEALKDRVLSSLAEEFIFKEKRLQMQKKITETMLDSSSEDCAENIKYLEDISAIAKDKKAIQPVTTKQELTEAELDVLAAKFDDDSSSSSSLTGGGSGFWHPQGNGEESEVFLDSSSPTFGQGINVAPPLERSNTCDF